MTITAEDGRNRAGDDDRGGRAHAGTCCRPVPDDTQALHVPDLDKLYCGKLYLSVPLLNDIIQVGVGGPVTTGVIRVWRTPAAVTVRRVDGQPIQAQILLVGLLFVYVPALTVTEVAQIVGTLLVLSLAITSAAAAGRLSARTPVVIAVSIAFALIAADGGFALSLVHSDVKASVFISAISFVPYVLARVAARFILPTISMRRCATKTSPEPSGPVHEAAPTATTLGPPRRTGPSVKRSRQMRWGSPATTTSTAPTRPAEYATGHSNCTTVRF